MHTILNNKEDVIEIDSPSFDCATNNQMELSAVIYALKYIESNFNLYNVSRVIVITDSMYVSDNFNNAKFVWLKNKWFLKNGAPVLNAELWKDLIKVISRIKRRVEIRWIKGHSKDTDNKSVDKIAKRSAKSRISKLYKHVTVRRKLSANKVNPGCIKSVGQRISIRVITDEYLTIQKLYKYRIEVISKKSQYNGYVDFLYSRLLLKAGHSYVVSLKKNDNLLTISKILREIVSTKKTAIDNTSSTD